MITEQGRENDLFSCIFASVVGGKEEAVLKWSNIAKLTVIVVVVALLGIGGAKPIKNNIRLGLDLRGGTHLVLNLVDTPEAKVDEQARQGVIRIINDRINQFGVTEPLIYTGRFTPCYCGASSV